MTGAQIPSGADAVVMFEQTIESETTFTIRKSFKHLENISLQGEEIKAGDIVLHKGMRINSGVIAVLATYGYTKVRVARKPTEPGKIRNSNGPMIKALAKQFGIQVGMYKVQHDNLEKSIEVVKKALSEHDLVITTGGVSVGDFDYLPEIYKSIQAQILFNKVAQRPGSVTTVAFADGKYLFGLSGNPSACYTGFELYVKPAVNKLMGAKACYPQIIKATLMEDFNKANPFTRLIRAKATLTKAGMTVIPSGFNKSGAVVAIAHANAMIMLPGGTRGFKAGNIVDVILTESNSFEEELIL